MRVRRVAVADQVVRDDASVVLLGHTVIHLSPLATVIMAEAAAWTTAADLTAALERQLGPPPESVDAQEITEAALRDLELQGLIERA